MANEFKTSSVVVPLISKLADKLPLLINSNKSFDKNFVAGNGQTISVKVVGAPTVSTGSTIATSDVKETTVDVTVSQKNVSMELGMVEEALDVDNLGSILDVYADKLGSNIEQAAVDEVLLKATTQVATSSVSFSDLSAAVGRVKKARSYGEHYGLLDPVIAGRVSASGSSLFLPSSIQAGLFENSKIGKYAGANFLECYNLGTLTTGTCTLAATANVKADLAAGATSITLQDDTLTGTIKAGQGFTVAGVYSVDTFGESTGQLYTFVALADATAAANEITVSIEAVNTVTTGFGDANVSALPVAGAVATQVQDADSSYVPSIIYNKNAFIVAQAKMKKIEGTTQEGRYDKLSGLNMTGTRGGSITGGANYIRIDVLIGYLLRKPNFATVIWEKQS